MAVKKATEDPQVREQLLEAAIDEMSKSGRPDLMERMVRDLGEEGLTGASMSEAFTTDPNRDESYVTVYSTLDGTPSNILKSMLPKVMRKRIPRDGNTPVQMWGKLAFDFEPPLDMPVKEVVKCFLHPEHPLRPVLNDIGLLNRYCNKANIPNEFERHQHERFAHKQEVAVFERHESEEREKQWRDRQDRQEAWQRELIERMMARDNG